VLRLFRCKGGSRQTTGCHTNRCTKRDIPRNLCVGLRLGATVLRNLGGVDMVNRIEPRIGSNDGYQQTSRQEQQHGRGDSAGPLDIAM
jgi:hypothetical protein